MAVTATDSTGPHQPVERQIDETVTTTTAVPELSAAIIADIYSRRGPDPDFRPDDVAEGDFIVFGTACDLLSRTSDSQELALVHHSFHLWFVDQLEAVGASAAYISSWDPGGMIDDLAELGCAPAASPISVDLG